MKFRQPLNNIILVVIILASGYGVSFFHRVCPSVLALDLMKDLSLDAVSFGMLGSATMLGYAITQLPSGIIADIFGGRKTITLYQILSGIFCILFALCDGLVPAVAARFFMGLTLAGNVPAYRIIAASARPEKYAMYCSFLTGFGTLGSLAASSPLVAASNLMGWRLALIGAGCFTILLGLTVFMLIPDNDLKCSKTSCNWKENTRRLRQGLAIVARSRNFWLIFIWFMFIICNLFTLATGWLGGFLMEANGFSKEDAGLCLSIMSILPLFFLPLCPWLSDNVLHSRKIFLLAAAFLHIGILGWICFSGYAHYSFTAVTTLAFLLNFTTICLGPISFTMVKESVPASALGSACGLLNCSAPILATFMQSFVGKLIAMKTALGATPMEAYSFAFIPLFAGAVIAVVAALFMKDTLTR